MSESLSDARALVTGASGFLGTHLCRRLLAEHAEVHAVSRSGSSDHAGLALRWWQCDTVDAAAVGDLIGRLRPDVIFHFGGLVTAAPARELVLPTFHSLLASTVNILQAVTDVGSGRVVLAGSLEEPTGTIADAPVPTSPYAAAKLAASSYARMFVRLYGASVVNLRTFMTYGPAQKPGKVIPYTILSLLRGATPELSSGDQLLDWVYVDDVVDAFIKAARAGVDDRTLDIGSGTAVRLRDLVDHLVRLVDPSITPRYGTQPDRPDLSPRVADVDTTVAALGWRPTTSLDHGLARTVEWYRRSRSLKPAQTRSR
jgi:nucleoside-diphosphate-sugar epimerase